MNVQTTVKDDANVRPGERHVPTLDTLSEGQVATIRRIPHHEDAPEPPSIEATRPNAIFTDPAYFAREQDRIFRRFAVPVTVSALLREPGSLLAHDGYGVPLLITRAKDGRVRAFINACQHKGSKIVEDCEVHKQPRMTCPYHAWTYGLDGKLLGVARSEVFKNLDKEARGLVELPSRESGGIIYVQLDPEAEPDFSKISPELEADFEALRIPEAHVYGRKTFHLKANWKTVLEPFLEGYHVQRLHAESIGDQFPDTPNIVEMFGPNVRQISGRINFDPKMLDAPGENIHKTVTHAYVAFPTGVVITSPYYISVMIIMPNTVDTSTVEYMMLTREAPDNPKAEALFEKSYALILDVFGNEDFRAAEISQVGLSSGVPRNTVYGGLEINIVNYYEAIEALL